MWANVEGDVGATRSPTLNFLEAGSVAPVLGVYYDESGRSVDAR